MIAEKVAFIFVFVTLGLLILWAVMGVVGGIIERYRGR